MPILDIKPLSFSFFFFKFNFFYLIFFNFIFKLYIIVLVLPNIKTNLPQVCIRSPSWTPLHPPSPHQLFIQHFAFGSAVKWHAQEYTDSEVSEGLEFRFIWLWNPPSQPHLSSFSQQTEEKQQVCFSKSCSIYSYTMCLPGSWPLWMTFCLSGLLLLCINHLLHLLLSNQLPPNGVV